jgi:hypothetical protein
MPIWLILECMRGMVFHGANGDACIISFFFLVDMYRM